MSNDQTKRTATQRLDDQEKGLISLYQTVDAMIKDLMMIKDAVKLMNNKVDSVIQASQRGEPINNEVIASIMTENNVEEFRVKCRMLVAQGVLKPSEQISENSFIALRILDLEGKVLNPRLQCTIDTVGEPLRARLIGLKAGETAPNDEKSKIEIIEVYSVHRPDEDQAAADALAQPEVQATEAPAAEAQPTA